MWQAADTLGITQRKYSYPETGLQSRTTELPVALSRFYKASVAYLLFQTDDRRRYPVCIKR